MPCPALSCRAVPCRAWPDPAKSIPCDPLEATGRARQGVVHSPSFMLDCTSLLQRSLGPLDKAAQSVAGRADNLRLWAKWATPLRALALYFFTLIKINQVAAGLNKLLSAHSALLRRHQESHN